MSKSLIPKPNFVVALISTAALFFVCALAALLIMMEKPIVSHLNSNVFQFVELNSSSDRKVHDLKEVLVSHQDIDSSSISWKSGDDAIDFMYLETGLDFSLNGENPFSDVITFKAKPIYRPDFTDLANSLEKRKEVKQVFFQQDYFDMLKDAVSRWKNYLIIASIIIVIIAFTILSGLFRLILYAERNKIKTMELVGATHGYIMRPYLGRFLLIGLISIGLASIFIWLIWHFYLSPIDIDWTIFINKSTFVSVGLVWASLLFGILVISIVLLRSFMNKSLEELA